MNHAGATILLTGALCAVVTGCENEQPPKSVQQLMDNEIWLDAAMVRCSQNRAELRYDAECMNAREAVKLIEAAEDEKRRVELEKQSERKRQALRRTQRAAAEARRRAAEEERLRDEADYLAQFGELPPGSRSASPVSSNAAGAELPTPPPQPTGGGITSPYDEPAATSVPVEAAPNAPAATVEVIEADEPPASATDLEAIREELKRRNDGE